MDRLISNRMNLMTLMTSNSWLEQLVEAIRPPCWPKEDEDSEEEVEDPFLAAFAAKKFDKRPHAGPAVGPVPRAQRGPGLSKDLMDPSEINRAPKRDGSIENPEFPKKTERKLSNRSQTGRAGSHAAQAQVAGEAQRAHSGGQALKKLQKLTGGNQLTDQELIQIRIAKKKLKKKKLPPWYKRATNLDMFMYVISMPWKVVFSVVPPPGELSFVLSY